MRLSQLVDEDFANFKQSAMFLGTTRCSGKCFTELGLPMETCQNCELMKTDSFLDLPNVEIIERYLRNPITHAIVIGGLEPMDTWDETLQFMLDFRKKSTDALVIYTGYYPNEVYDKVQTIIESIPNVYIKYGRYIPNQEKVLDHVLSVYLASSNQFGVKVS